MKTRFIAIALVLLAMPIMGWAEANRTVGVGTTETGAGLNNPNRSTTEDLSPAEAQRRRVRRHNKRRPTTTTDTGVHPSVGTVRSDPSRTTMPNDIPAPAAR